MKKVFIEEVEKHEDEKYVRPVLFKGERTTTLLLCLKPGQSVPSHRHEGFEIVLQPLRGEAEAVLEGQPTALRAGELVFVDGANDFAPVNKGGENFSMLITLVRR
ncbi:MAG TPA: cupin domain-containing protein [Pyrinomonadaceae bacterium]|nr:cupin domain-containing protein [Pyrinomonadaceae bacterium]